MGERQNAKEESAEDRQKIFLLKTAYVFVFQTYKIITNSIAKIQPYSAAITTLFLCFTIMARANEIPSNLTENGNLLTAPQDDERDDDERLQNFVVRLI